MEQIGEFILNHIGLWVALTVILILVLINEWLGQKNKASEIGPSVAVKRMNEENAHIFDIRDKDAFKAGHIIDAIRVDQADFGKDRLKKYRQQPIIIVCNRGLQSQTAASKLREQGFEDVSILSGGMNAWLSADLPVVKDK